MTDDAEDTVSPPEPDAPQEPRRRGRGVAAFAIIIAIVALAVAAWSVWRLERFTHAEQTMRKQNAATIAQLENRIAANNRQARTGTRHIGDLETELGDLRTASDGLKRRVSNLENAYTTLSGQQQSGRDTLLLNDAEMLLRAGQQRYDLFHDANGALKAYTEAIRVLAEVHNPVYAPVRASAETERNALAAAAPPSRQHALDVLSSLRNEAASLPLATGATSDKPSSGPPQKPGFWSRVAHFFSGVVTVSRDRHHAALEGTHFARQTLALDLAQAQESLLALDDASYHNALQGANTALGTEFDTHAASVQQARSRLGKLLSRRASGPAPKLGGALAQLETLRASRAPAPATSTSAPAPAASTSAPVPATSTPAPASSGGATP